MTVPSKRACAAIGIDLGGTNLRGAVVENGKLIGEPVYVETPDHPEKIVDALVKLIEDLLEEAQTSGIGRDAICGVGIATAGVVNCDTGEVIGSTGNLPGWAGTKIREVVEARTGLSVHVENDANAAAYGEARVDELKELHCIVVVTLGTGIGGGIVIDGKLLHGRGWAAGEIGHMSIALDDSRLCTCGLHNCWEAYGSGRGLLATTRELLAKQKKDSQDSSLFEVGEAELTTYKVFQEAKAGDWLACAIVRRWHEHITTGIVNLTHILNPDCFVITGGLSQACDLALLKELTVEKALHNIGETVEIRASMLETNAGLIGAAQSVIDEVGAGVPARR